MTKSKLVLLALPLLLAGCSGGEGVDAKDSMADQLKAAPKTNEAVKGRTMQKANENAAPKTEAGKTGG